VLTTNKGKKETARVTLGLTKGHYLRSASLEKERLTETTSKNHGEERKKGNAQKRKGSESKNEYHAKGDKIVEMSGTTGGKNMEQKRGAEIQGEGKGRDNSKCHGIGEKERDSAP